LRRGPAKSLDRIFGESRRNGGKKDFQRLKYHKEQEVTTKEDGKGLRQGTKGILGGGVGSAQTICTLDGVVKKPSPFLSYKRRENSVGDLKRRGEREKHISVKSSILLNSLLPIEVYGGNPRNLKGKRMP